MSDKEKQVCPKCGEPLSAELVAKVASESCVIFKITPAPGEMFELGVIGDILVNLSKLMRASSRELGAKAITLLDQVDCHEDGSMAFNCIIARGPKTDRKRGSIPVKSTESVAE